MKFMRGRITLKITLRDSESVLSSFFSILLVKSLRALCLCFILIPKRRVKKSSFSSLAWVRGDKRCRLCWEWMGRELVEMDEWMNYM